MSQKIQNKPRGAATELKFFNALRGISVLPFWIKSFRAATEQEDHQGVDAFVRLDVGVVPVQIKTSRAGAAKYRESHKNNNVLVVFIEPNITVVQAEKIILRLLYSRRRDMIYQPQVTS